MTRFDMDVANWKPALAVVAAHGMTDMHTWEWVPHYATWMLLPMPSCIVTGVFCAASFIHFADDGGPWISALAHATVAAVGVYRGTDAAFKTMLAYLCFWHTPVHYRRHWKEGRKRGVWIAGASTLLALLLCRRLPNRVPFGNLLQRVVLAHIAHEISLR
jgi:hypothetical protein